MAEGTNSELNCIGSKQNGDVSILIVGKVGVGKSTLGNIIFRHLTGGSFEPFPERESVESLTRECEPIKSHSTRVEDRYYQKIMIVDVARQFDKRPNSHRMKELEDAYKEPINVVILVVQRGDMSSGEKLAFEKVVKHSDKKGTVPIMIITHCEELMDNARSNIQTNYNQDPSAGRIVHSMKEIATVGFPNTERIDPELKALYDERIKKDSEKLNSIINKYKFITPKPPSLSGCLLL